MAVETKAATHTSSQSAKADVAGARRRLRLSLIGIAALVALCVYGFAYDDSIHPDPFGRSGSLTDWLLHSQPHPAMAEMPVVPIGRNGTLTLRPAVTAWINSPLLPVQPPEVEAPKPAAAASLLPTLVRTARAAEEPSPKAQETIDTLPPQQPLGRQDAVPDAKQQIQQQVPQAEAKTKPKGAPPDWPGVATSRWGSRPANEPRAILDAQCLADGRRCWLAGELGWLLATADGGASWTRLPLAFNPLSGAGNTITDVTLVNFAPDGRRGFIHGFGDLFGTEDGGDTWGRPEAQAFVAPFTDLADRMWIEYVNGSSGALEGRRGQIARVIRAFPTSYAPSPARLYRDAGLSIIFDRNGEASEPAPPGGTETRSGAVGESYVFTEIQLENGTPVGWIGGVGGGLVRYRADGDWQQVATETKVAIRSIWLQPDGEIGWLASGWSDPQAETERPEILQTTDGGETWEQLPYRHRPAPWLLYLVLPGLAVVVFGAGTAAIDIRNAPPARESVADEAATDSPIGWEDRDALGLQPVARALSKFLRNLNTEPPLTFAVTGAWGTGKSSLMNLVAEDLRGFGARSVWFNAWHHQKEEHLLAALLENVRAQAIPAWWRWSGLTFRVRLVWQRSGRLLQGALALSAIVGLSGIAAYLLLDASDFAAVLDPGRTVTLTKLAEDAVRGIAALGSLGVALYAVFVALTRLRVITLDPAKLMASVSERARVGDFRDQIGFRYKFRREFGEVCRALRFGGSAGMVIMIDDLDRCRPENVLDVLEAVNFLTSAGPCFIFLGIDEEKVTSSVAHGFRDSILVLPDEDDPADAPHVLEPDAFRLAQFARSYLEKLVNITVPVPQATPQASAMLLNAYLKAEGAPTRAASSRHGPERTVGEAEAPPSPWPRRLRNFVRNAQDVGAGVATVAAVAVVLVFALTKTTPLLSELRRSGEHAQIETTDSRPTTPPLQGTQSPAEQGTGTATEEEATREPTSAALPVARVPEVAAEHLTPGPDWIHYAVGALAVLGALLLLLGRLVASRDDVVRDSPEFRGALAVWNTVIFSLNPTPRGVKRYQNRLRYFAMRARGDDRKPDWVDRLCARMGAHVAAETAARDTVDIPEPTLVALGTIAAAAPETLAEDGGVLRSTPGRPAAADHAVHPFRIHAVDAGEPSPVVSAVDTALARFQKRYGAYWPPTAEQVRAFRRLSGGIED